MSKSVWEQIRPPYVPVPPLAPAEPPAAKVALVLNEYRLVLAAGSADGVCHGAEWALGGERITITDPTSGEVLGDLARCIVYVRAAEVHERFTVCEVVKGGGRSGEVTIGMEAEPVRRLGAR